jgi:hypothetical protein
MNVYIRGSWEEHEEQSSIAEGIMARHHGDTVRFYGDAARSHEDSGESRGGGACSKAQQKGGHEEVGDLPIAIAMEADEALRAGFN